MPLTPWNSFFQGELGAAAALAGLLFVSVSVNQAKILSLGRMADRGLEALVMLFLVIVVASLPLIPGQPLRLLGAEIMVLASLTLSGLIPLQRQYLRFLEPRHHRRSRSVTIINRFTVGIIAFAGLVILWRGDMVGLYFLPVGILLSFLVVGINAWVLLIEINR